MSDLLEKIESYQIILNILPGAFFITGCKLFFGFDSSEWNVADTIVLYYVIGLLISRFGSLIIEPILKKVKWLVFAQYKDFVEAEKRDDKVRVLSEANNLFRSLLACVILYPIVWAFTILGDHCSWISVHWKIFVWGVVLLLLLFSYRKQTNYVRKRVESIITRQSPSDNP